MRWAGLPLTMAAPHQMSQITWTMIQLTAQQLMWDTLCAPQKAFSLS